MSASSIPVYKTKEEAETKISSLIDGGRVSVKDGRYFFTDGKELHLKEDLGGYMILTGWGTIPPYQWNGECVNGPVTLDHLRVGPDVQYFRLETLHTKEKE